MFVGGIKLTAYPRTRELLLKGHLFWGVCVKVVETWAQGGGEIHIRVQATKLLTQHEREGRRREEIARSVLAVLPPCHCIRDFTGCQQIARLLPAWLLLLVLIMRHEDRQLCRTQLLSLHSVGWTFPVEAVFPGFRARKMSGVAVMPASLLSPSRAPSTLVSKV